MGLFRMIQTCDAFVIHVNATNTDEFPFAGEVSNLIKRGAFTEFKEFLQSKPELAQEIVHPDYYEAVYLLNEFKADETEIHDAFMSLMPHITNPELINSWLDDADINYFINNKFPLAYLEFINTWIIRISHTRNLQHGRGDLGQASMSLSRHFSEMDACLVPRLIVNDYWQKVIILQNLLNDYNERLKIPKAYIPHQEVLGTYFASRLHCD
jgi:hypothetical protein